MSLKLSFSEFRMSKRRNSEPIRVTYIRYKINIPKKKRTFKNLKKNYFSHHKLYYMNGMQHKSRTMRHPWYQLSKKHEMKLPPLALIKKSRRSGRKVKLNSCSRSCPEKYFSFTKHEKTENSCSVSLENEVTTFFSPMRIEMPKSFNFPPLINHQQIVIHDLVKKFHWMLGEHKEAVEPPCIMNDRYELFRLRESYSSLYLNDLCNDEKRKFFKFEISDLQKSRMRRKLKDMNLINTALRKKNKNHLLIVNFFRSGLILENMKKYKQAIKAYEKVILLCRKKGITVVTPSSTNVDSPVLMMKKTDENTQFFNFKSHVYCHIGCCFQILYLRHPQQKDYFDYALLFHKKMLGVSDENGKALSFANRGLTYLYAFDVPKALEMFELGLNVLNENGEKKANEEREGSKSIVRAGGYGTAMMRIKLVIVSNIVLCLIAKRDLEGASKLLHQVFLGDDINNLVATKKIQTGISYLLLAFIKMLQEKLMIARQYFALAYKLAGEIKILKDFARVCFVKTKVIEASKKARECTK